MERKPSESLMDYSRRYMKLYNEVEGCSEQLAVTAFKLGLQKKNRLWLSLIKRLVANISDLTCLVEDEDEARPVEQKEERSKATKNEKGNGRRPKYLEDGKSVFKAINTMFKEPIFRILPQILYKLYFRWLKKLPDYPGKENHKDYCAYHQDWGHRTRSCRSLRQHLEDLVRQGHLKEYIDESRARNAVGPSQAMGGSKKEEG